MRASPLPTTDRASSPYRFSDSAPGRRIGGCMSLLIRTSHRVAAGLGVLLLVLAAVLAARHREAQQGWDLASGSNDLIGIMLLVTGSVMAFAFALLRPSRANPRGAR